MGQKLCLGLPDRECWRLTSRGPRCPDCTRRFDQLRGTARQRGYDRVYEANREYVLSKSKICWRCGKPNASTAGHVIARIHGGTSDVSNLAPECASCNYKHGGGLSRGGRGAL